MKTRIFLGLCVVLGTGLISVRAADNLAQAAARAALEQKMSELDHPQTSQTPPTMETPQVPRAMRIPTMGPPNGTVGKIRHIYAAISLEKC